MGRDVGIGMRGFYTDQTFEVKIPLKKVVEEVIERCASEKFGAGGGHAGGKSANRIHRPQKIPI